jgi:hypothetical protein
MDRHIQLLHPEVLAANIRVIAMPIKTQRARARADDAARGNVTRDNTTKDDAGNNNAKGAPQVNAETLPEPADIIISVRELLDEIAN